MKLTKLEKETIILFNEQEDTAEIYTHNTKLQNRCNAFAQRYPELVTKKGITFTIPKNLLTITLRTPVNSAFAEKRRQQCQLMNQRKKATTVKEDNNA
jgi:ethanolamine utilization cobalamin adenosyltransferase